MVSKCCPDIFHEHVELQAGCNGCVAWTYHFLGMWDFFNVSTVLRMAWTDHSYCFLFATLQAASNGTYIDSCLDMLVGNFTPPNYFTDMLKQPRGIARKDQVLSRVHSSLKVLADLVPLSPMRLLSIIIQRKPHYCSKETVSLIGASHWLYLFFLVTALFNACVIECLFLGCYMSKVGSGGFRVSFGLGGFSTFGQDSR